MVLQTVAMLWTATFTLAEMGFWSFFFNNTNYLWLFSSPQAWKRQTQQRAGCWVCWGRWGGADRGGWGYPWPPWRWREKLILLVSTQVGLIFKIFWRGELKWRMMFFREFSVLSNFSLPQNYDIHFTKCLLLCWIHIRFLFLVRFRSLFLKLCC